MNIKAPMRQTTGKAVSRSDGRDFMGGDEVINAATRAKQGWVPHDRRLWSGSFHGRLLLNVILREGRQNDDGRINRGRRDIGRPRDSCLSGNFRDGRRRLLNGGCCNGRLSGSFRDGRRCLLRGRGGLRHLAH